MHEIMLFYEMPVQILSIGVKLDHINNTSIFSPLSHMRTFVLRVMSVYNDKSISICYPTSDTTPRAGKSSTSRVFHTLDTGFYWSSAHALHEHFACVLQLSGGIECEWECCSSLLSVEKKLAL